MPTGCYAVSRTSPPLFRYCETWRVLLGSEKGPGVKQFLCASLEAGKENHGKGVPALAARRAVQRDHPLVDLRRSPLSGEADHETQQ